MDNQETPEKLPIIDYDGRWKTIIEEQFDDFMAYFMPNLYEQIDFSKEVSFLDKELQNILPKKERTGKRISDCLAKVFLKNGVEKWVLVHIEVQNTYDVDFSARMFKYYYRIFDKYEREIAAIAIFTSNRHPKKYNIYHTNFEGTELTYKYNTYKITEQSEASLQESDNPFALVVLANKYVLASKKKALQRLQFKIKLLELLRKRNFSRKKIVSIFKFIKYLLILSSDLELEFENFFLDDHQNKTDMREPTLSPKDAEFFDKWANAICGFDVKAVKEKNDAFEQILEEALRKAEQNIEQERQKVEQERRKALEKQKQSILNMYHKANLNVVQIADILVLDIVFVQQIIDENIEKE